MKTNIDGKWSWHYEHDGIWPHELFDTREQAIEAALSEGEFFDQQHFFVAKASRLPFWSGIDADSFIEAAIDNTYDDVSDIFERSDISDDVCEAVSDEACQDLENRLEQLFNDWVEKHDIKLSSYLFKETEQINVARNDEGEVFITSKAGG